MVFANRATEGAVSLAEETELDRLASNGAWQALVTTGLQPIVGWWVMMSLPAAAQQRLMGGDSLHTLIFVVGVGAGLGLVHPLFAAASGDRPRESTFLTVALFAVTVVCMTATLRMAVGT